MNRLLLSLLIAVASAAQAEPALDTDVAALLTAANPLPDHIPTEITFTLDACVLTEVVRNIGYCRAGGQNGDRVITTRIHLDEVDKLAFSAPVGGRVLIQFGLDTDAAKPHLTLLERLILDREAAIARLIERQKRAHEKATQNSTKTFAACGDPARPQPPTGSLSMILTHPPHDLSLLIDAVRACRERTGKSLRVADDR